MDLVRELTYGRTRCYLINGTVLIDTDWPDSRNRFLKCMREAGVELSSVKYLLITHFHPDHMGFAQELANLGIQIVVFDVQRAYIHAADPFFEKNKIAAFKRIEDRQILVRTLSQSRPLLESAGVHGEVIFTPGHSRDSISVILDNGAAIVGDLPPLHLARAYADETITQSWKRILSHHVTMVYYGHAQMEPLQPPANEAEDPGTQADLSV